MSTRRAIWAGRAWWILITLGIVTFAYKFPAYNWDTVGYIGCALEYDGYEGKTLQTRTYEELRKGVSETQYEKMRSKTPHRVLIASDPEAFEQTIRFYRARVGYITAMRAFHAVGVSWTRATVLLAVIPFLLLSYIAFVWLRGAWGEPHAAIIVGILLVTTWSLRTARTSTPDMFTALLICTSMWAQRDRAQHWLRDLALLLAVVIRADALVFAWVVWGVDAVASKPRPWIRSAVMCALSAAIYFGVSRWSDAYQYSTLFTHAFIERQAYPAQTVSQFNVHNYIWAWGFGLNQFVEPTEPHWSALVLVELAVLVSMIRRFGIALRSLVTIPFVMVVLAGIARFVLWPAGESRFYFAYHFVLLVIVLEQISKYVMRGRVTS